ncbi:tRNA glutamyl-Q(34) synthetase GluQRS [Phyllobacterium phragmitis]|uniref:tRNA glutamyl-Q(34) synthetase GluQRS n=1 Tax=Phyllobacterium phragmitis TaxID=2670329 RepID=A0A2S9IU86_9HYPH|nr:tRNA glutamyl-Q(34) synthetase GluQRS [Phyllobacterium phragmitis]PRD44085.1 tRNA glutamyl-Q(34) synthetase GluQRS [Phyllobacterium phragmitis]
MNRPVFRFAPSPNGLLHLGHAYSALLNARMAAESGGRLLLRIEDIDTARCTPELERRMIDDLRWLGLSWEEPVRRQSQHFTDYQAALDTLIEAGLVYPAFMSRGEVRARIEEWTREGREWPHDPDGVPLYPEDERTMSQSARRRRIAEGGPFAWRLNVPKAVARYGKDLFWDESGAGPQGETDRIAADPARWGDVVIARKETPTSYHLSVVIDDALQGITHVVRGRDLFHATAVHRLLQEILGLPVPLYHHHDLILDEHGRKLSKSRGDTALAALRQAGMQPEDIRRQVGL